MSLGPCAEAVGLSVASTYSIAVGQLPLMFIVSLHYPAAKADFFATAPRLVWNPATNVTAVDLHNPTQLHYMHSIHIGLLFLACAALICIFSITTMYMNDKGLEADNVHEAVGYRYVTLFNKTIC